MALLTDDMDIRDVRLWIEPGGNGDYYINLKQTGKTLFNEYGSLVPKNVVLSTRISMSGGNAPRDVQLATAALFRALEQHGLNKDPLEDNPQ